LSGLVQIAEETWSFYSHKHSSTHTSVVIFLISMNQWG